MPPEIGSVIAFGLSVSRWEGHGRPWWGLVNGGRTASEASDSDLEAALQRLPTPPTLAATDRPDMPLVAANSPFLELGGHAREEVVGHKCRFLRGDLENDAARAELRYAVERRGARRSSCATGAPTARSSGTTRPSCPSRPRTGPPAGRISARSSR
jgi:hypothetical protein